MAEAHPLWGRNLDQYPSSYTKDIDTTRAPENNIASTHEVLASRMESISAMSCIRDIGSRRARNSGVGRGVIGKRKITEHVTLSKLKSVLRLTHEANTFSILGSCELVGGCIRLMESMGPPETPSPFSCEYGYLCFRICVIAMNVCLLEYAGHLKGVLSAMASERDFTTTFWYRSAELIGSSLQNNWHLVDIMGGPGTNREALFYRSDLKSLLHLLHEDRKHFLTVLDQTNSLGLSGMMFVLWKYLATEPAHRFETSLQLFSPVFWRYLLVMPEYEYEDVAICLIQNQISLGARLSKQKWIDLEDSRNVMQIYINRIPSTPSSAMMEVRGCNLLRLVEPLVVPGCEDLLPSLVGLSIRELWGRMINPRLFGPNLFQTVKGVMLYFRDLFKTLRPKRIEGQPWVYQLADEIVESDLVDIAIRALSEMTPSIHSSSSRGLLDEIFTGTIEMFVELADTVPKAYLVTKFDDCGSIGTWLRYFTHFQIRAIINALPHNAKQSTMCTELIMGILWAMGGQATTDMLLEFAGTCDNPRCPMPVSASFTCANCTDLMYCDMRCLATDWTHPWEGPHKKVCKAQSAVRSRSPFWLPKYYHTVIDLPSDFRECGQLPTSLVRDLTSHIRRSRN